MLEGGVTIAPVVLEEFQSFVTDLENNPHWNNNKAFMDSSEFPSRPLDGDLEKTISARVAGKLSELYLCLLQISNGGFCMFRKESRCG